MKAILAAGALVIAMVAGAAAAARGAPLWHALGLAVAGTVLWSSVTLLLASTCRLNNGRFSH